MNTLITAPQIQQNISIEIQKKKGESFFSFYQSYHFVYCYLPSPIQTLLSALVSHQIHRFINLTLIKRVTGLEFYVHSSPPVGNFTRPRRRSHIMCNHNYLINCIVHLFLLIIKYFLSSTIFALQVKGKIISIRCFFY